MMNTTTDTVEERVQIIAEVDSDRALIDSLLSGSDVACETAASAETGLAGTSPGSSRTATILCHRTTTATPYPSLGKTELQGRVVVFSDCVTESVVVETLERGAHHYFDINEPPPLLKARLAAALRSHAHQLRNELRLPPFRFDPGRRCVWSDDRMINLSPKEFELAYYLFWHRGRMVGNRELMTTVWSLPRMMDSRRIDTAACRVRKKMELDGSRIGWYLERSRGEGYRLVKFRTDDRPATTPDSTAPDRP